MKEEEDAVMAEIANMSDSSDDSSDEGRMQRDAPPLPVPRDIDAVSDEEFWRRKRMIDKEGSFTNHLHWITALRSKEGIGSAELREARQAFSAAYPLPPIEWQRWIDDERSLHDYMRVYSEIAPDEICEPLGIPDIVDLYQRSGEDYLDVSLLSDLISYMTNLMVNQSVDENMLRATIHVCLESGGAVVTGGERLWDAALAFETSMLSTLESVEGVDESSIDEQEQRVRLLYVRYLSTPVNHLRKVFNSYQKWEQNRGGRSMIEQVKKAYEESNSLLSKLEPMEKDLQEHGSEPSAWLNYVQFLKDKILKKEQNGKKKKGKREEIDAKKESEHESKISKLIKVTFERGVRQIPLSAELWMSYVQFLQAASLKNKMGNSVFGIGEVQDLHERALKHCPQQGGLWASYLRVLERAEVDLSEIDSTADRALNSQLSTMDGYFAVLSAHCQAHRRYGCAKADEGTRGTGDLTQEGAKDYERVVHESVQWFATVARDSPQYGAELVRQRAAAMAKTDVDTAISILKQALKSRAFSRLAAIWLDLLQMCILQCYPEDEVRVLFKKAVSTVSDYPDQISTKWLEYESTRCSLEDFLLAEAYIAERRPYVPQQPTSSAVGVEKRKRDEKQREKGEERKRRRTDIGDSSVVASVFVGNLPFRATENELGKTCEQFGNVVSVKFLKPNGRFKGCAFVGFSSMDSAIQAADLLNGYTFHGRKLNADLSGATKDAISKKEEDRAAGEGRSSEPKSESSAEPAQDGENVLIPSCSSNSTSSAKNAGRDSATPEKTDWEVRKQEQKKSFQDECTAFVSNLPLDITEEKTREIFGTCGEIVAVRLIERKGVKQGYGYVQFKDKESVANAIDQKTGEPMGQRRLKVVMCNPTKGRRVKDGPQTKESGGREQERVKIVGPNKASGPKRFQIGFVPPSLRAKMLHRPASGQNKSNQKGAETTIDTTPKSNDDFRNLLLGKK